MPPVRPSLIAAPPMQARGIRLPRRIPVQRTAYRQRQHGQRNDHVSGWSVQAYGALQTSIGLSYRLYGTGN